MPQQYQGVLRHILTFAGGYVVAKGIITEEQLPEVIGAVITIGGLAWSWFSKKAV